MVNARQPRSAPAAKSKQREGDTRVSGANAQRFTFPQELPPKGVVLGVIVGTVLSLLIKEGSHLLPPSFIGVTSQPECI
jgi:hypothetical protein